MGSLLLSLALALAAGVLTIAAPCILPMLPILLGASVGQRSRVRPLCITLGFVLSFSALGLLFGVFAQSLGASQQTLRDAAVAMLLAFGVLMLFPGLFERVAALAGGVVNRAGAAGARAGNGNWGGFVLGMTLGVVWTPCAGPVLGSILTLVATSRHLGRAAALLCAYAVGAGIPMLAIAYGGQFVTVRVRRLARHAALLQRAFGVVVIGVAVALYFQYDTVVTLWLSSYYPDISLGL